MVFVNFDIPNPAAGVLVVPRRFPATLDIISEGPLRKVYLRFVSPHVRWPPEHYIDRWFRERDKDHGVRKAVPRILLENDVKII